MDLEQREGVNVACTNLSSFREDLEVKLSLMTGLCPNDLDLEKIRKPLLVLGDPGIGKTCVIMDVVKTLNKMLESKGIKLGFKKILLGQTVVGSLQGIPVPVDGKIVKVQDSALPNKETDGEYGVLFLDEITTADEMQIQPALGLTDDSRNIGEYTLPEHWLVVAAGNGPNCTNFVRLDDMTVSRFAVYDINYDYRKDFRGYAHQTRLHEDIISFLNFKPELCIRTESTDMDKAGKLFPCPRTWERLSTELKMRDAFGKPVTQAQMSNFAGRIIGIRAAREFAAFLQFKVNLNYSPKAIIEGTERDPEPMEKETFHIILEACIKILQELLDTTEEEPGVYPLSTYNQVANFMNWILSCTELENKINAFVELRESVPKINQMLLEPDFSEICPKMDEFFMENHALIVNNINDINNYNF